MIEDRFYELDSRFAYGITAKMLADQGIGILEFGNQVQDSELGVKTLNLGEIKQLLKNKTSEEIDAIFEEIQNKFAFYQRI